MSVALPRVTFSGIHFLDFGTPLDNPSSTPFHEQTVTRVPGTGQQDSWTDGIFQRAKLSLRWIPASGTADNCGWNYPASGVGFPASGVALNVAAWKAHQLQQKDDFVLQVDRTRPGSHTCRIIPGSWQESKESSGYHYRVDIEIEDVNGVPFTEF